MPPSYHLQKVLEHLKEQTEGRFESMKQRIASLKSQNAQLQKECDQWHGDALCMREQFNTANKSKVEARDKLDATERQLKELTAEKQKLVRDLEATKKLRDGEREARKESEHKRRVLLRQMNEVRSELDRSKAVGKQLLDLAAKLQDDGSAV